MNHEWQGFHISHVYFLGQDLSHLAKIFDLHVVALTLMFDLLFKNFNLGHKLWTVSDRALIFHMCIPCDKTFHIIPSLLTNVTLTLKFDILFKNFNLGHKLWTVRDRAFRFQVYSLWQDLSHNTIMFDLVTLTLKFDLLFKNFNLGNNLWTVRYRDFIFHMGIPCDKTFHIIP